MNTVATAQIENILLDAGVIYLDYGLAGERILAPTRGGNSFKVEQDIRIIERDGAMGKEKGLRRVIREDATLTVKCLDLSIANLKMALAGSTATATKVTSTTTGVILASEYFTNVTFIGTDMEGKNKVITLKNPLVDGGLSLEFPDKDEAVMELVFSGHRDPTIADSLYTIEETESIASNLTGLVVTTAVLEPTFAAATYSYGSSVLTAVTSVTVTPTLAGATITLRVNGIVVATGVPSAAVALAIGVNVITVTVTETAKTNKTYTITIVRAD